MPELPEVETVRLGLLGAVVGETIEKVEIFRAQSIAHPAPKKFSGLLPGQNIADITRRGKYLLFHLENPKGQKAFLVIHLRMSGRLLFIKNSKSYKKTNKFLRVQLFFKSGKQLLFEDMRVFGRLWFVAKGNDLLKTVPALAVLGPEPLLGLTGYQLKQIFRGRRQAVKAALLNQSLLAGIGNIYADEILFKSGIHPLFPCGQLSRSQLDRLRQSIPTVLQEAIALGGASIKDFKDSDGVNGNYQHRAFVYGRARLPCRVCGTAVEKLKIAGRSAHFCPYCQGVFVNSPK